MMAFGRKKYPAPTLDGSALESWHWLDGLRCSALMEMTVFRRLVQ